MNWKNLIDSEIILLFINCIQTGNEFKRGIILKILLSISSQSLELLKNFQEQFQDLLTKETDQQFFPQLKKLVNQIVQ